VLCVSYFFGRRAQHLKIWLAVTFWMSNAFQLFQSRRFPRLTWNWIFSEDETKNRGRCYDYNFLRLFDNFRRKVCVFLKKPLLWSYFCIISFVFSQKKKFSLHFYGKSIFKNHNIDPWKEKNRVQVTKSKVFGPRHGIVFIACAYRTEDPGFESRRCRVLRNLYIAVPLP
jgi:hypothetical protein